MQFRYIDTSKITLYGPKIGLVQELLDGDILLPIVKDFAMAEVDVDEMLANMMIVSIIFRRLSTKISFDYNCASGKLPGINEVSARRKNRR